MRAGARAGSRWQPVVNQRSQRRAVGRRPWRLPRVHAPRITLRWQRGLAFACLGAVIAVGGFWLYRSPLLTVQDAGVKGNAVLTVEQVRAVAGIEGQSIFRTGFASAEARLRALPLVKDVTISRDWPNGARITVVERQPWGYWQAGSQRYVIDDDGVVIDRPAPQTAPAIVQTDARTSPLAVGDRVPEGAVAAAERLVAEAQQTVGLPVTKLEFSQRAGLTVTLGDSLRVVFGDVQGYEYKIAALFAVLQQAQDEGRNPTRVDLRFGDRVAVQ
ncbi:MAG: FtsQ-type POTRA domain-containing protein [Chloroflexi bacterium]|nr:FtsQ-type POTRA domain-containing protein [Chloroflexota bacterium]